MVYGSSSVDLTPELNIVRREAVSAWLTPNGLLVDTTALSLFTIL